MPVTGQDGDRDEGAEETDVEDDSQKGKEGDSAQEACQDGREGRVDDCDAGHAFHGFFPSRDRSVVSREPWKSYCQ